jgi:hypothetical protein
MKKRLRGPCVEAEVGVTIPSKARCVPGSDRLSVRERSILAAMDGARWSWDGEGEGHLLYSTQGWLATLPADMVQKEELAIESSRVAHSG